MANVFTRPSDSTSQTVINVDTAFTLDKADCPCVVHNLGATGTIEVELPQDAKVGTTVQAIVTAAQILRFNTTGGAFYINGAAQTDGKYIGVPAVINSGILMVCIGNDDWITVNEVGTVLVEA